MKVKHKLISFLLALIFVSVLIVSGCSGSKSLDEKTGAQLWGENCVRCHNAPSPTSFSDEQWETVTLHMRVRANLTEENVGKIVDFLQMAN